LATRKPGSPTLEEWSTPWWIHGECPYIAEKLANGYNISRKCAEVRRSYLTNHLVPEFGKYRITQLKPRQFCDFKMRLYNERKLSPATINGILGTARGMLNYAFEMGDLETNPVAPVKELKKTPQARGILEIDEPLCARSARYTRSLSAASGTTDARYPAGRLPPPGAPPCCSPVDAHRQANRKLGSR